VLEKRDVDVAKKKTSMTLEIPVVTAVAFAHLSVPEFAFEAAESISFSLRDRELSAAKLHRLADPTTQHRWARLARELLPVPMEFGGALSVC
jgi:hypothetical protein